MSAPYAVGAAVDGVPMAAPALLEARGLARAIGRHRLVDDASLEVRAGELVGLIGPNGAGKSTLVSMLAGLDAPQAGEVLLDGRPLRALPPRERAREIGWLEQIPTVHWPVSVERLVALGRIPHLRARDRVSAADLAVIDDALERTDCTALRARTVTTLSGGERTRVLLARVLAGEPRLVLADEPVAALDPSHQLQTMELLRDFARGPRACVAVLHDLSIASRWCDRLYLMHRGRIETHGAPHEVLDARRLREVYGIEAVTGHDEVPWIVPLRRVGKAT